MTEQTFQIHFLADFPDESYIIARWYFDEWAYTVSGVTPAQVHEKVLLKANSRHEFPLAFVVHDENNKLVATAELKIRENIDFPEYEHWLGGVYVEDSARGKGYAAALVLKTMFLSLVLPKCSYNANNIMKLYIGNMAFDLYITLYITTFKLPLWFGSNLS